MRKGKVFCILFASILDSIVLFDVIENIRFHAALFRLLHDIHKAKLLIFRIAGGTVLIDGPW